MQISVGSTTGIWLLEMGNSATGKRISCKLFFLSRSFAATPLQQCVVLLLYVLTLKPVVSQHRCTFLRCNHLYFWVWNEFDSSRSQVAATCPIRDTFASVSSPTINHTDLVGALPGRPESNNNIFSETNHHASGCPHAESSYDQCYAVINRPVTNRPVTKRPYPVKRAPSMAT